MGRYELSLMMSCWVALLGQRMGSESALPYLSPELTGQRLLVGANFASAGIGILNDTGIQFVSDCHTFCIPYLVSGI